MDWQDIRGGFLQDGSLRDIYIANSSPDDWPTIRTPSAICLKDFHKPLEKAAAQNALAFSQSQQTRSR
jgi:hypothetical protein